MKENLYTPDCIRTFTGKYVNVFDPTPDMICIEDIAHALSKQCRFGGHLPIFYSVAQHSVSCSMGVEQEHKLAALLHDASEAYLLDMPSPIEHRLPIYKSLHKKLMQIIAVKFDFEYPLHEEVKRADRLALEVEWLGIMLAKSKLDESDAWSQRAAEKKFLERFYQLKTKNS